MAVTAPEHAPRRATFAVAARSTLFAVGLVLSTIVYAPLALLSFPLSYPRRYRFITGWTRFNLWWLGVTCGLTFEVLGLERIIGLVMAQNLASARVLVKLGLLHDGQVRVPECPDPLDRYALTADRFRAGCPAPD